MIRAEHYDATERVLMTDPVIQDMARELPDDGPSLDFFDSWYFIQGALREYRRRGGAHQTHIGGPAAAIRRIIRKGTV
jgi:hypothetical protein